MTTRANTSRSTIWSTGGKAGFNSIIGERGPADFVLGAADSVAFRPRTIQRSPIHVMLKAASAIPSA